MTTNYMKNAIKELSETLTGLEALAMARRKITTTEKLAREDLDEIIAAYKKSKRTKEDLLKYLACEDEEED